MQNLQEKFDGRVLFELEALTDRARGIEHDSDTERKVGLLAEAKYRYRGTTIVEQAKQWKKFSDQKVGTEFIREFINEMIQNADADRRQAQKEREAMIAATQHRVRVNKLWDEVKRTS